MDTADRPGGASRRELGKGRAVQRGFLDRDELGVRQLDREACARVVRPAEPLRPPTLEGEVVKRNDSAGEGREEHLRNVIRGGHTNADSEAEVLGNETLGRLDLGEGRFDFAKDSGRNGKQSGLCAGRWFRTPSSRRNAACPTACARRYNGSAVRERGPERGRTLAAIACAVSDETRKNLVEARVQVRTARFGR